ncbi:putative S-adenosyl-L-methionine-dependent tRNA 4-demethylwyosine synthase-like [Cocos nucifera]|uniref:Putative S-adenosyl-L-methionine-dependent tRNA 4-demethylwyosine synthase-like n=1 Tax=Cocos nucifera TaxID=13894 RepID=A0A8K0NCS6_COCNU|nr:putative S-adenosyl-L-methionine-dependent tRNA 4-demethylwyosine synthase-like [Cocos nucifera]
MELAAVDMEDIAGKAVELEDIAGKAPSRKSTGPLSNGGQNGDNGLREMVTLIIRTSLEKQACAGMRKTLQPSGYLNKQVLACFANLIKFLPEYRHGNFTGSHWS